MKLKPTNIKSINRVDLWWTCVNAVDDTSHEFLYRGADAVDAFL